MTYRVLGECEDKSTRIEHEYCWDAGLFKAIPPRAICVRVRWQGDTKPSRYRPTECTNTQGTNKARNAA